MRMPLSLLAAAALLILTMVAGFVVDLRNEEMHSRHQAIGIGLEKIVRYNQELNAMLLVAVLERNTLRCSSYDTVFDKLELTVSTVEELTQKFDLASDIAALRDERRELRKVELDGLHLMEADRWEEARKQLFDEQYVLARKIYEINSETAIGALNGELTKMATMFRYARHLSLALRLVAVVLLLWAGVMFSRRLRLELKKQQRLKSEIEAANIQLEDKVRARTLELEEANRKLANLSITDSLTRLANRRRFDEVLIAEWQRAKRKGASMALAMLDVDQFKLYNDHFGHQAGDICLQKIAAVLRRSVQRSGDLVARYGGEEFVIVLPGIGGEEAGQFAESIRKAVQAEAIEHTETSQTGFITVSIGVSARKPAPEEDVRVLLREADNALYSAKRKGRNKVEIALPLFTE